MCIFVDGKMDRPHDGIFFVVELHDFYLMKKGLVESLKHLPEGYERMWRYLRFYLLSLVWSKDFAGLASVARGLSEHTLRWVFQDVLRIKKWIQNTWLINEWAVYYKDKVYLDGYHKISNFVRDWWDTEKMMVGKVKVEDLKYL